MGDRCLIQVVDSGVASARDVAPCSVYLHCDGDRAIGWLRRAIPVMRVGDVSYSTARLIGVFHTLRPGNLGLGVMDPVDLDNIAGCTQGDAGVVVYDCTTGQVELAGGYLAKMYGADLFWLPTPDDLPVGTEIGQAIAASVMGDAAAVLNWPGFGLSADVLLTAAGLTHGSGEWNRAKAVARFEFNNAIQFAQATAKAVAE